MTEKEPGAEPEEGPGTEPEKAPDKAAEAAEAGLADSIYGHTNTFYTAPKLNQGVPPDPRFIRVLSTIEIVIGVVLFALIVIGVMYQVLGRYFPSVGWVGAGELALMSMVAMTFITTGYLVGPQRPHRAGGLRRAARGDRGCSSRCGSPLPSSWL